jgi:parvulin-like peptidyl-prolyl isomerase
MPKLTALLFATLLLTFITACSRTARDPVVARVNGVNITASDVNIHLDAIQSSMAWEHFILHNEFELNLESSHPESGTFRRAILEEAVRNVAFYVIIDQYAAELNITLSGFEQQMIDEEIAGLKEEFGEATLRQMLQDDGFRGVEQLAELYVSQILMQNVVRELMSNAERFAFFTQYMPPEEEIPFLYGAQHILLMFTEFDTEEEARAEAQALWERALAGEEFETLIMFYGHDPGMWSFPDGYSFSADDNMMIEFIEATRALAMGEISPPVRTDFGYHVIKRTEPNAEDWHALNQTMPYTLEDRMVDAIFIGLDEMARAADIEFLAALYEIVFGETD